MVSLQAGQQEGTASCRENTLKCTFHNRKQNCPDSPSATTCRQVIPLPEHGFPILTPHPGQPQAVPRPNPDHHQTLLPSFFKSPTPCHRSPLFTLLSAQIHISAKTGIATFPKFFLMDITDTHKIKESIQIETNSVLNLCIYQSPSPQVFSWLRSLVLAWEMPGDRNVWVTPGGCSTTTCLIKTSL